jgi:hypothetical protein
VKEYMNTIKLKKKKPVKIVDQIFVESVDAILVECPPFFPPSYCYKENDDDDVGAHI